MGHRQLDRSRVRMRPLAARANRITIEQDHVDPSAAPGEVSPAQAGLLDETAERIRQARRNGRPVMAVFGAHTIKNGLGPVLASLLEDGWLTHLATNGAGIIHDWEFAFLGQSSENVAENVARGEFGNWEETGFFLNLALNVGAYEGRGYGESIGSLIHSDGLSIPTAEALRREAQAALTDDAEHAAAVCDLLAIVERFNLKPGWLHVPHRWKRFSAQAAAFRLRLPFTGHPMIGHDIIYNHPMNHGGALGRAALRDFLVFAEAVRHIEGGVYLSVGSAVMSPMIFEKSLSMAQNLAAQEGQRITGHYILVADLAPATWDWSRGEPPESNPAYYQRYNKSFSRMGGTLRYLQLDNRDLLLHLRQRLAKAGPRA